MSKQIVIKTSHLNKCLNRNEIIRDCSMSVEQGTIYGFLGANGAGKSTFFKLLTGLLTPDIGSIEILGLDSVKDRDSLLVQIGSIIETPIFYEHLSAQKNLEIHLSYMNTKGFDVEDVLRMVGLFNVTEKPVSRFSMGMRQRLAIARAIIHQPKILILDEPINGLDPMGIKEIRELLISLTKNYNMTILLSSHILSEIEQIADRIGVIVQGHIVDECDMSQININDDDSLEDYFFRQLNGGIQQ